MEAELIIMLFDNSSILRIIGKLPRLACKREIKRDIKREVHVLPP
jgi:hypothetical protein